MKRVVGIDINQRTWGQFNDCEVNGSIGPDDRFMLITSFNALAYCQDPITEMIRLLGYLEEGGLAFFHLESYYVNPMRPTLWVDLFRQKGPVLRLTQSDISTLESYKRDHPLIGVTSTSPEPSHSKHLLFAGATYKNFYDWGAILNHVPPSCLNQGISRLPGINEPYARELKEWAGKSAPFMRAKPIFRMTESELHALNDRVRQRLREPLSNLYHCVLSQVGEKTLRALNIRSIQDLMTCYMHMPHILPLFHEIIKSSEKGRVCDFGCGALLRPSHYSHTLFNPGIRLVLPCETPPGKQRINQNRALKKTPNTPVKRSLGMSEKQKRFSRKSDRKPRSLHATRSNCSFFKVAASAAVIAVVAGGAVLTWVES